MTLSEATTEEEVTLRRPLLLKTMFEVLAEAAEPLPAGEVLSRVAQRVDLSPHELSENDSGARRFDTLLRFSSSWASKIGWLAKRGGWSLTEAGLDALARYEPDQLYRELTKRYRLALAESKKNKKPVGDPRWDRVVDALALVEAGSWTSYGDLAELTGLSAQSVGGFVANRDDAPNGHRVLQASGEVSPGFRWADPSRTDDPRKVLEQEGLEFDGRGRAIPAQRMTAEDLRALLEGMEEGGTTRRAWLVRGSSVNGRGLVPVWLSKGTVSLAASRLRAVEPGISRAELKPIVEVDYEHTSYSARAEKLDEFHAFLSRMQVGDVVVTTSQGRLYVGEITGGPTYQLSKDERSNLRRSVDWKGPAEGIDYAALPAEVAARLQAQRDVLDLTLQLDLLKPYVDAASEDGHTAPKAQPKVVLADATDELAESLHVGRAWLQECIDLLNDRPQLIFYGPPGTGKTYLAQELATHVAGDNVKLVQFHPAYSYEDFFEGYRPVQGDDGMSAGFKLKAGPLRSLVDQAEANPSAPYILIIDELNRGNLAKIFGELYFLLEYRDKSIDLLYTSGDDKGFTLPKNVFILGTMNTADRSIALVDAAMRRRFAFLPLHPSEEPTSGILRKWLTASHRDGRAADLLDELNSRIDDTEFKIGPSYLMRAAVHQPGGFERAWKTAILPLLEEHHYGDSVDVAKKYGLETVSKAVDAKAAASAARITETASPAPLQEIDAAPEAG